MTDDELKKIFHNLKNDLTSMTALLNLHKLYKDSISTEELLNRLYERQIVIATAYEKLYQEGDYPYLNLVVFINELIERAQRSLSNYCRGLQIRKNIENTRLPIKTAASLGQLIVELLSNSCRHAFIGCGSKPEVEFHITTGDGKLVLEYSDNGSGFPEDFEPGSARTLGMQFIKSISRQYGGVPQFEKGTDGHGMSCRIEMNFQA